MGKKRSSSQIEKLSTTAAPKDDQPLTPAPKDDEKPSPPRPEEGKVEEQDDEDLSSASSSSEAEDEDEDEAEDDDEEDDSSKNATPPANSHPNPKTEDDSDSEDEEETDSDSEDEPAPKLKSLNSSSKPLDQIKSKAEPKPSAAPARSGTKRPTPDNDPKQAKKTKTGEEDNKKSGDDSKRLFQRVFNEDDEMAIIKGLYDFITKTQTDPFKYHSAFYEFVKKSIHFKVTLEQLRDKIRRLKHKYETKAKTGKTPNFSKQNDRIIFEFSQKIWGGKFNVNEAEEKGKPNGKLSQKEPAAKKPRTTKKLVLEPDSPMVVKETRKVERTDTENRGPSLALNELIRFDESVSATRETIGAMKRGMELIEESERKELARRWEKVQIAEMEVFKMRADLAVDQAMSILDALKSSSSNSGSGRTGVIGMATRNTRAYETFSIFINKNVSEGKLLFGFNYSIPQESRPLIFNATSTWQVPVYQGTFGLGTPSIPFSGNLMFDPTADTIALPKKLYSSFIDWFKKTSKVNCVGSRQSQEICFYSGDIAKLAPLVFSINGQNIEIPAQVYAKPSQLVQDAIELNIRASDPSLSHESYVNPSFADSIILDSHVMSHYYSVFHQRGSQNVIELYRTSHYEASSDSSSAISFVAIAAIAALVVVVAGTVYFLV